MAGPRPDDPYNPVPEVAPQTGSGNDYLNVRATPESFGAPVGEALRGTGQMLAKQGDQAVGLAIERQGQLNETAATYADTDNALKRGEIYGKFRSLTGSAAVAAAPGVVTQIQALWQKTRDNLPNDAARRAYDQMSLKSHVYTITDINSYAAGQVKEAGAQAAEASAQAQIDSLSNPAIANDPYLRGHALGVAKFNALTAAQTRLGLGDEVHLDAKTGAITFDDTPQGHQSEAIWNNYWQTKIADPAYTNIVNTMAYDSHHPDVAGAMRFLDEHGPKGDNTIPAAIWNKLEHQLDPAYKAITLAHNTQRWLEQDSYDHNQANLAPTNPDIKSAFNNVPVANQPIVQAVGGHETSNWDVGSSGPTKDFKHAGLGQFDVDTWKRVTGETILPGVVGTKDDPRLHADAAINAIQRYAEMNRAYYVKELGRQPTISELALMHQQGPAGAMRLFKADPNAIAATVLPENVLRDNGVPAGATVQQAIQSIESFYGGSKTTMPGDPNYVSPGTYLSNANNYLTLYDKHYNELANDPEYANRPDLIQQQMANWENGVHRIITAEKEQGYAFKQDIADYLIKAQNSGHPVGSPLQLYAVPGIKEKLAWLDQNDSLAAISIRTNLIPALSKPRATTLGIDYYKNLQGVVNGSIGDAGALGQSFESGLQLGEQQQPLTNSGFASLVTIQKEIHDDPNKKADYQQFFNWLSSGQIRGAVTGTGKGPGVVTPKLDKKFTAWTGTVLARFQAGLQKGETPAQMLDPNNKSSYIGGDIPRYSLADFTTDIQKNIPMDPGAAAYHPPQPFDPNSIKDKDGLFKAKRDGKIDKKAFEQAAIRLGLLPDPSRPRPQPVPLEH